MKKNIGKVADKKSSRAKAEFAKRPPVRHIELVSCLLACMSMPMAVHAGGSTSTPTSTSSSSGSTPPVVMTGKDKEEAGAIGTGDIYLVVGCKDVLPAGVTEKTAAEYCLKIPTPRECYRTRLETQINNASVCSKLKKVHGVSDTPASGGDSSIAPEYDTAKYPDDMRCGGAPKLDADRDGDGKDGNEDDGKTHPTDGVTEWADAPKTVAKPGDCSPGDKACEDARKHTDDDFRDEHGDDRHGGEAECDDDQAKGCEKYHGLEKVTICHVPPGHPEQAHTITVTQSALRDGHMDSVVHESDDEHERHKLHGDDYFGACSKTVGKTKDLTPTLKPMIIQQVHLPYVIKEYRDCLDPGKGGGNKTVLPPGGTGKGGRLNWREVVE
ncbi:MAG: hypothetical protein PHE55_08245 [Methylococcaceae bacterium]|nr:hypothetical protein [Methylococcaceae bacterium]